MLLVVGRRVLLGLVEARLVLLGLVEARLVPLVAVRLVMLVVVEARLVMLVAVRLVLLVVAVGLVLLVEVRLVVLGEAHLVLVAVLLKEPVRLKYRGGRLVQDFHSYYSISGRQKNWSGRGLNSRLSAHKTNALPTELQDHVSDYNII